MTELDFKDMACRTERFPYLDPLIEVFIKTKKIPLSLIESKKYLDYTIIYLCDIYSQITKNITELYQIMLDKDVQKVKLYRQQHLMVTPYQDFNNLYYIIEAYSYFLLPLILKKQNATQTKTKKLKTPDHLSLMLWHTFPELTNYWIVSFIKRQMTEIIRQFTGCNYLNLDSNAQSVFFPSLYTTQDTFEIYNEKTNKRFNEIVATFQKEGFKLQINECQ